MSDRSGGDSYGRICRKLDHQTKLAEVELSALFGVVLTAASNHAHSACKIERVFMLQGSNRWSQIERDGWEEASAEVAAEQSVTAVQPPQRLPIITVYFWSKEGEGSW